MEVGIDGAAAKAADGSLALAPRLVVALTCSLALLSGCSKPQPPAAAAPPPPPYNTDVSIGEVMEHVMTPAAYEFWSGWGVVVDKNGDHDLTPKTDADWKKIEDGAATVVLSTNAIMVPGYARAPQAEWYAEAQKVAKVAWAGKMAAEKHDSKALGEIGEQLDTACDGCHMKFVINKQP